MQNVSPHNWEVFLQSFVKRSEHLQSSPHLANTVQTNTALIDLIKIAEHVDKYPHLFVQSTADKYNIGFFTDGEWVLTQNAMLADDNLLADVWSRLNLI